MSAHGPVPETLAWVNAVMEKGRLDLAWPLTDPTLRLALVQQWILEKGRRFPAQQSRDRLAEALAAEQPTDPLWGGFARWRVRRWRTSWGDLGSFRWGVWTRPEPVGVDLEVVTLVRYEEGEPLGETIEVEGGSPRVGLRFIMRSVDRETWRVAGFGGRLAQPGWPPMAKEIAPTLPPC